MYTEISPKDANRPTYHPTRLIHHLTLTSLSLTFFLSLILLVLSIKYGDFVVHTDGFKFSKNGA